MEGGLGIQGASPGIPKSDPRGIIQIHISVSPSPHSGVPEGAANTHALGGPRQMTTVESEARRALNRLNRALEKSRRELDAVRGALEQAEGEDFPVEAYQETEEGIARLQAFVAEEGRRLQEKVLHAGGLEPGRIRRSSAG